MDTARLKESFARVAMHGDEVALFFYSDLFFRHPETRGMFPVSMAAQRDHLLQALARIVSVVDHLDQLTVVLQGLGRDHRKFGTLADHYEPVGVSLLATLAHFSGESWTPALAADWQAAYGLVAQVMTEAAAADEKVNPAFWDATVISHERRAFDTAVFRVAMLDTLNYLPGQSVAIESELCPRIWPFYSIANAPDVVARSGSWTGHDAYLAGPTPMVDAMAARLASLGVPQTRIHVEDFGWSES